MDAFSARKRLNTARGRALATVSVLIALGLGLSIFNVPLASSAAITVDVAHIDVEVPKDPQSELWERAQQVEVPLSAQQIYQPGGGTTRAVRVRALEDGHTVAFRVSWSDDTRNDVPGNVPSDAAAIQLPIDPEHIPYQCMGQSDSRVNIWQWKAVLERQGFEEVGIATMQGAGVRNLTSNGICKAVDTPGIEPAARSFHDGQEWHVVFYRALAPGDVGTAPLPTTTTGAIAFAVWNGARGEARGMKAVSTWTTLQFRPEAPSQVGNLLTLGVVFAVSVGAIAYAMRRMARG